MFLAIFQLFWSHEIFARLNLPIFPMLERRREKAQKYLRSWRRYRNAQETGDGKGHLDPNILKAHVMELFSSRPASMAEKGC